VTNLAGVSVRQMSEMEPYDTVGRPRLEKWCQVDEWLKRRQRHFEDIRAEVEATVAKKLVEVRVKQLEEVDTLFSDVVGDLKASVVEAKSKEGLIGALVKLLEAGDHLRDKLAQDVVPQHLGSAQQGEGIPLTPKLTDQEAAEAARAILKRRREETRRKLAEGRNVKPVRQPRLRVVKGEDDA